MGSPYPHFFVAFKTFSWYTIQKWCFVLKQSAAEKAFCFLIKYILADSSAPIFQGGFSMEFTNEYGKITLSSDVLASIAGAAAINCFGVKGMVLVSLKDGLVHLLKNEYMSKGVKATIGENGVEIELHIAVNYGVNISAVCKSIISEVRYNVERFSGAKVASVDIYVDSIRID